MADNTPKYYRVGPDGKAPTGLNAGDYVVTGGGTYRIDAVHSDGSYVSSLVDKGLTTETYQGEYAVPGQRENPSGSMKELLSSWSEAALRQKEAKIDEQTAESVAALGDALLAPAAAAGLSAAISAVWNLVLEREEAARNG